MLSERLVGAGVRNLVCVATEYGELLVKAGPLVRVHRGRMGVEEIRRFVREGDFGAVVDATHPYAKVVSRNIRKAVEGMGIPFFRLERECEGGQEDGCERGSEERRGDGEGRECCGGQGDGCERGSEGRLREGKGRKRCEGQRDGRREERGIRGEGEEEPVVWFENHRACAGALERVEGNILLTVGSKELGEYCASKDIRERLYARVLPAAESLALCARWGIRGRQIIAMQGPFSAEMNEAVIRQYGIACLVTKDSGRAGGFGEKLEAAWRTGIKVFVIGRPKADSEGMGFEEVCRELGKIYEMEIGSGMGAVSVGGEAVETEEQRDKAGGYGEQEAVDDRLEIILAGAGMGSRGCLTREVEEAIDRADILMGAKRVVARYPKVPERYEFYQAEQIIPFLKKIYGKRVVILFSGDTGFYSGCGSVYRGLRQEIEAGRLMASVRIMPGISSAAYLASCIGESYEDGAIYSIHGRDLFNLAGKIRGSRKLFLLTSGVRDVNRLGEILEEHGLTESRVVTGYQLSCEDQEIKSCTPGQCRELKKEGLYTCLIENPWAREPRVTHGIRDCEFIRGNTPMTKEEVREVSICKMRLCRGAVVYDIGSGTGSVAVEIAGLWDDIQVYALERKREAVSLIEENKRKFYLENIFVTEGEAPEGLGGLPKATHAFIGGSGGRMREILDRLRQINPHMRVVINTVTMETICELKEILEQYRIEDEEIVQLQVNRMKQAGAYHMMSGENPVWICAFRFCPEETQGCKDEV